MRPDARNHVRLQDGQAEYLRQLVAKITRQSPLLKSQRAIADEIGVKLRTFVDYLGGTSEAPYTVQFALERLAMTPQERDDARAEDEAFDDAARRNAVSAQP